MTTVDEKEHVFEDSSNGEPGEGVHTKKCWCGGPDGSPFDPIPKYKVGDEVYVRYKVGDINYETYTDRCELVYSLINVPDLEEFGDEFGGRGYYDKQIEKKVRKKK